MLEDHNRPSAKSQDFTAYARCEPTKYAPIIVLTEVPSPVLHAVQFEFIVMLLKSATGSLLLLATMLTDFSLACIDWESEYEIQRNQTHLNLDRRYYAIEYPPSRFWPQATIPYCFDNSVTDTNAFGSLLTQAWQRWIDAGVDENQLTFRQGSAAECANPATVLTVFQTTGGLSSSPGRVPGTSINPGPAMRLNSATDIASGDLVANFAHGIGHAWGSLHDHQRPDLWTSVYGGSASSNTFTFNCQNLADYEQAVNAAAGNTQVINIAVLLKT